MGNLLERIHKKIDNLDMPQTEKEQLHHDLYYEIFQKVALQ
jgi:hypothetical protein